MTVSTSCLSVLAVGQARGAAREQVPASARKAIRYADPAAWAIAAAVASTLGYTSEVADHDIESADSVGIIAICEAGPAEAMTAVSDAARAGYPSPMRYPAANPGSLAGVACIAFRLHGPSLSLPMPPVVALSSAAIAASAWMRRAAASSVLVATCSPGSDGSLDARCCLTALAHGRDARQSATLGQYVDWLSGRVATAPGSEV